MSKTAKDHGLDLTWDKIRDNIWKRIREMESENKARQYSGGGDSRTITDSE